MKRSFLLLSLLSLSLITGCKFIRPGKSNSGDSTTNPSNQDEITVIFYADYNQKIVNNVYHECTVFNGNLITDKPADPTQSLFPEFPVFKGWSYKEIIDNNDDLWDFSTDKVNSKNNTFELFGIWVAEGE